MGEFRHPLTLIGPHGEETVDALVDTGATFTWVPGGTLERLGVPRLERYPVTRAGGREAEYDLGELRARLDGRERPTLCIVGDEDTEPLLGAVTLEEFLLMVDPVGQRLVPRSARLVSPRIPKRS